MKSKLYYLLALVLIASCSSPKYTYNFDHYNYNSAKKTDKTVPKVETAEVSVIDPIEPSSLIASTDNKILSEDRPSVEGPKAEVRKTYAQMDKSERKEFRKNVKNFIKEKKKVLRLPRNPTPWIMTLS